MKSRALLGLLADGQIHSGESLAASLGVSRTAVWKQVRRATDEGYAIETLRGRGYRLSGPLDLIDAQGILEQLPAGFRSRISLQVHDELDSTNAEILRLRSKVQVTGNTPVCLADFQTAGRGRRGRRWQSPRGENLYLSLGLTFRGGFAILDGLSLAMGLAVAQALEESGSERINLKWPNDLLLDGAKLAGILIELQGELEEGVVQVVVGIGVNVHMSHADEVDQAWTSLAKAMSDRSWQRSRLAAAIIASVLGAADRFAETGFSGFRVQWQSRDMFRDRELQTSSGEYLGLGRGVDEAGNYLVDVNGRLEKIRAGEISLRAYS